MEIIGFCLGTLGFILGSTALARLKKLEKHLKETGILDNKFKSDGSQSLQHRERR